MLRSDDSLRLTYCRYSYMYMCRRIPPRTSELTNPIAAPGRCSKPTTGLSEVQREKKEESKRGGMRGNMRRRRKGQFRLNREDLRKGVKARVCPYK